MTSELPNASLQTRTRSYHSKMREVERLCMKLHEISNESNPMKEATTEAGKDLAAFKALELVGEFCNVMAQWAIDHQLGLAHEDLTFVYMQPSQTCDHPDYITEKEKVDSHRHEIKGAKLRNFENCEYRDYSGKLLRNILKNLVVPNPLSLPHSIKHTYLEAFNAVDLRSVHSFFEYPKTQHAKNNYSKLRLQLKALTHVLFRKEIKEDTTLNIQEHVASAYGITSDYLRKFEKNVRAELGNLEVDRELSFARNAASSRISYNNLEANKSTQNKKDETEEPDRIPDYDYRTEALQKDGIQYQELELSGKKAKIL